MSITNKHNKFTLRSIISNKLTDKEIKQICLLKDKEWSFGFQSQIKWFKNNIKNFDFHNLFYVQSKLIGYTLLRKRTCKIENIQKSIQYLLFDTLIIDKKYRGKNMSNLLMNFNNIIIQQSGLFSFLNCSNELVSFYKKNNWKKLKKNMFSISDYSKLSNGMVFNKKDENKKYIFFTSK